MCQTTQGDIAAGPGLVSYEDWHRRTERLQRRSSAGGQTLTVYITGFGPFGTVVYNPTSAICRWLQERQDELLHQHGIRTLGLETVEVSAEAARAKASAIALEMRAQTGPACVIHMGVAVGIPRLHLECRAINNANFIIPDARGWVAKEEPIVAGAPAHEYTALPLSELMCELRDAGIECEISSSAGSYICNYIYFCSLYEGSRTGVPVLFVHLPDFSTVPEEQQARAIEELLLALKRLADHGRL